MSNSKLDRTQKFGTTNNEPLYFSPGEFRRAAMFVDDKIPTITFMDEYLELRTEDRIAKILYISESRPNDTVKKTKFTISNYGGLYDLVYTLPDDLSEAESLAMEIEMNNVLDTGNTDVILARTKAFSKDIFDVGVCFSESNSLSFFINHKYIDNCGLYLKIVELKEE